MLALGLLLVASQETLIPLTPVAFGRFEGGLSGTVLDEHGTPLDGARVEWRVRSEGRSVLLAGGWSQVDGRFVFKVERSGEKSKPLDAFLEVEFPGLAPTRVEQLLAPDQEFELGPVHVYPFAELHGRVTTVDGAPIPGARIHAAQGRVTAPSPDTWSLEAVAVTDANGKYSCRSVPSGVVTLGVSAEGFADLVLAPRSLALRSPNELVATLVPSRSVALTVLASATNTPVMATCTPIGASWPQAEVGFDVGAGWLAFWRGPRTSDDAGRLILDGLSGDFAGGVLLEADGCAPQIVSLAWKESEVSLSPANWVEVSARRQGSTENVEFAALSIRNDAPEPVFCGNGEELNWTLVTADSLGVERLAPQRWRVDWNSRSRSSHFRRKPSRVLAFLNDGSHEFAELTFDPATGEARAEVEFNAPARLVGRVVTPSGEGLKLDVNFRRFMDGPDFVLSTDANGHFDVQVGSGWLLFQPLRRGWTLSPLSLDDMLEPGATEHVLLTATRTSWGRRLRGNVTIGGAPPEDPLLLALGDKRDLELVVTHSDPTGRFEFDLAVPGTFRVTPLLPAPPDTSFREFRREIALRTIGSIRSLPRTSEEFDEVLLELPPLAEWPSAPRSER